MIVGLFGMASPICSAPMWLSRFDGGGAVGSVGFGQIADDGVVLGSDREYWGFVLELDGWRVLVLLGGLDLFVELGARAARGAPGARGSAEHLARPRDLDAAARLGAARARRRAAAATDGAHARRRRTPLERLRKGWRAG